MISATRSFMLHDISQWIQSHVQHLPGCMITFNALWAASVVSLCVVTALSTSCCTVGSPSGPYSTGPCVGSISTPAPSRANSWFLFSSSSCLCCWCLAAADASEPAAPGCCIYLLRPPPGGILMYSGQQMTLVFQKVNAILKSSQMCIKCDPYSSNDRHPFRG